jgi:ParB/RepB/Spo0J family partition protein
MASSKANDRLAEIRARVARRAAQDEEQPQAAPAPAAAPAEAPAAPIDDATLAAASAHFLGAVEQMVQGRTVERIPTGHIAPDERPEMRQPRLLPPPDALIVRGEPAPAYRALVAELLALGLSMRVRQIQPIIAYPGTNTNYPASRYLILVGHRRWTAANLVGLETLDAVVVDPPNVTERIHIQYTENEAREEFSDMERAWSLVQMKQALDDAPWETVEAQFSISRTRRHELTRMLAFTAEQQQQVALLRLQETQARPLHSGLRNGELTSAQADAVLYRLAQIAAERAAAAEKNEDGNVPPRRTGIDGPTVARLVARAQRSASPMAVVAAAPTPRWLPLLREQLVRTNQSARRAIGRADQLSAADLVALLSDVGDLVSSLMELMGRLHGNVATNEAPATPEERGFEQ